MSIASLLPGQDNFSLIATPVPFKGESRPVSGGVGVGGGIWGVRLKPLFRSHTHVYYYRSKHTHIYYYYTSIHFSEQTQVPAQGSAENVLPRSNSKNNADDYQNVTISATWYTLLFS